MDDKDGVFDNSLDRAPSDVGRGLRRSGELDSCTVIPGFDEGLLTMKSGIRRMYIPGELNVRRLGRPGKGWYARHLRRTSCLGFD